MKWPGLCSHYSPIDESHHVQIIICTLTVLPQLQTKLWIIRSNFNNLNSSLKCQETLSQMDSKSIKENMHIDAFFGI